MDCNFKNKSNIKLDYSFYRYAGLLFHNISRDQRTEKQKKLELKKIKQPGIGFPSASLQKHLLIIRMNLARPAIHKITSTKVREKERRNSVRVGLKRLCRLFERINDGTHRINVMDNSKANRLAKLSEFYFSATIGFGIGFFELLHIPAKNRPLKLHEMPDHLDLGDPTPYSIGQTDLLIQLGSSSDFVNRWVYENNIQPLENVEDTENISALHAENLGTADIVSAIEGWATIVDINSGFQRIDNRNLQGFNDGVSNPRRLSPLFDKIVWTNLKDDNFKDGTYMVFQKIEHDLDQWRQLELEEQEEWVGRSKGTGLLLGTLTEEEDHELGRKLNDPSVDESERDRALSELHKHFDTENPEMDQSNPETRFFDHQNPRDPNSKPKHGQIPLKCPIWSHVRKANPRQEDVLGNGTGEGRFPQKLIFRRGYPYVESGFNGKVRSGLLFICFQKDLERGFEDIKKNMLNNKNFPVPNPRFEYTQYEVALRHSQGRFTLNELDDLNLNERKLLGLADEDRFEEARKAAQNVNTQNTGFEGLSGPSELGVVPTGEFLAIVTLGGGYYFVPPIPGKSIANIGDQFFK